MTEKHYTLQELLDWCDKHHEEGKELVILWDGGGDSGWVHFQIDEEECSDPQAEQLVDMMYDQLDYGSWAGEFSASGQAPWDPEKKAFVGIDYYSEEENVTTAANIEVRVPKYIPFDEIRINTQDEEADTTTEIMIMNGFIHPETEAVEEKLNEILQAKFSDAIDKAIKENDQDFSTAWGDYRLVKSDFKEDGDELVGTIELVQYSIHEGDEKDVEINLGELLEEEE